MALLPNSVKIQDLEQKNDFYYLFTYEVYCAQRLYRIHKDMPIFPRYEKRVKTVRIVLVCNFKTDTNNYQRKRVWP